MRVRNEPNVFVILFDKCFNLSSEMILIGQRLGFVAIIDDKLDRRRLRLEIDSK